jgi:D-arabinose 1-dehydrogenase-like Zn-dependent alcohol dehydrogenase
MKAILVEEFKKRPQVKEVSEPKMRGPFDALVRIHASGVCHTDLHAADGDWPVKPVLPFIPGHEGVGIVEEVGALVTNIRPGDRVGIPWLYSACGECGYCLTGWETLCESQHNTGYSINWRLRRVGFSRRAIRWENSGWFGVCRCGAAFLRRRDDIQSRESFWRWAEQNRSDFRASAAWDTWRCNMRV